jgi:hypothetical protein
MICHEFRKVVLQQVNVHGRNKVSPSTVSTHQYPATARVISKSKTRKGFNKKESDLSPVQPNNEGF